jgi:glyoxylase-like metal-dependent hydrolase (beta-lactamase superfamily II)
MQDSKIFSKSFVFSPFQENTYLLYNSEREAVVIDPGMQNKGEEEEISKFISDNNLKLSRIILTHAHIDHVFGVNYLAEKYQLNVAMHEDSIDVLKSVPDYASVYGFDFSLGNYTIEVIEEGSEIEFGLTVLFVPGHVPGHLVFYKEAQKEMWVGDVLFYGSIGRTDLPGGNHDLLIKGIKEKILPMDSDIVVYSGHGPSTTIGFERSNNPFLQG